MSVDQTDAMIARLQGEMEERNAVIEGVTAAAQDRGDDLTQHERELSATAAKRIDEIDLQLKTLQENRERMTRARQRAVDVNREILNMRHEVDSGPVEYRTAGAWALDSYNAAIGNRDAKERLEIYTRAAAHQKTSDNLGVIPDPIVGGVVNFIDAGRPLVNFLNPQPLPSATFYRPKVTQRTLVDEQGTAGGPADEKAELVSQKMTITRMTGAAVTHGGYVNVSRQDIDFSTPQIMDIIINDLASQYAIQTEAVTGTVVQGIANNVEVAGAAGSETAATLAAALWTAVANIYAAVKGAGRIALVVPPSRLGLWGQLFAPVNPQNAQSTGFNAADFGSGVLGNISGIPVICSPGYPTVTNHLGSVISSAAVEVFEQRVGALQVTEPSVLGVQVAYAGYFSTMTIESGGVQRIVNLA